MEAQIPTGIPVDSQGRQPTRIFSTQSPSCAFGSLVRGVFLARVSPISPWKLARPLDNGRRSPSLVSLTSHATPRGECRRLLDLLLRPASPSGVPAANSSFASGDSPLPVPLHLLAPTLRFLLSSPHTFSCRSCKKSRSGEPYGGCEGPDVELRGHFVGMYALLLRIAPRTHTHTHLGTRTSIILLCRLSSLY